MNKVVITLVLLLFSRLSTLPATAPIHLVSLSPQVHPGGARDPLTGLRWDMSISSYDEVAEPNGEMMFADETVPYSHQGYFILVDPTLFEPILFPFVLDVPNQGDSNRNGIPDFFDRSAASSNEETFGAYAAAGGDPGELAARWSRSAGRSDGTVILTLPELGLTFTHEYNIPTYEGVFTYARTNNSLAGTVAVTNVLAPETQITGAWNLTILGTNRLSYTAGTWTGNAGAVFSFRSIDTLDSLGTNFVALTSFEDGWPETPEPDYELWFVQLVNSDENMNSVPDILEGGAAIPVSPRLEVARDNSDVQLVIHGERGRQYVVEGAATLTNPAWTIERTVTLEGSSAPVTFQAAGRARFFRLRQQ